ncbi:alpha/beta hydrolase [Solitalea longa]|uniref:Alpha/beta hydrolase n=1 Tax=Solitalea longa TaxID=2079460 RepID=A0A2S5A4U8_9SPHI|nr:alpha/beta hydrolase [Solitalea longa]POY37565.1 alpha/beta hydrolase [Solitalea longa]
MLAFIANISNSFTTKGVQKKRDLPYVSSSSDDFDKLRHLLNVYSPLNANNCDVLIFVHGGEWDSGSKNIYGRLGKGFASRNTVFVSINYRLAPAHDYKDMAFDVARAVKWVKENIVNYGGNPGRVFLSGHSAGGYLTALVGMDDRFFQKAQIENPLKGLILIDSFLLDLHDFFTITDPEWATKYFQLFGIDPVKWQEATPMNYLKNTNLPIQSFLGTKTYPGIMLGNDRFRKQCELDGKKLEFNIIKDKAHRAMITQLFFMDCPMYDTILNFIRRN